MRLPRALVALSVLIGLLPITSETHAAEGPLPLVLRVLAPDAASTARLFATGVDVLEARRGNELLVAGDEKTTDRLRAAGFLVTVDEELSAGMLSPDAFAGGYRTVAEHEQHLQSIATSRPDLATLVDFGDTWRKLQGRPGFDLLALCLTKKVAGDCALSPSSTKPRFLLMGAIHARELTTAELVWRFADHLVAGYGTDAEVTALLESTEIWLVPVFNADGRAIVEQGGSSPYLQRKNGNDTLGTCSNPPSSSNQHGIDLNRNASYGWGGLGTSTSPCSATYRGTAAASEPEEQAIEALLRQLFPDQRGPAPGDAAPLSSTG
ncbi:MAG: carboxypeptidase, partial [Acidobacteria bacterium]|nr:carboxypeptidase [Acidobacteriota bacterium]